MGKFDDQVKKHADTYKRRMRAIFQQSAQELFEEAQTTIPNGGRLPIDLGFLRASFSASLNGAPQGPSRNPGKASFTYDGAQVSTTINGAKLGDTIWAGWSAEYAIYMEARYGFFRGAAQNWPLIVARNTADAQARIR